MKKNQTCPLCNNKGKLFFKDDFFKCENCHGIFKNKSKFLNIENEKKRYELHSSDINNPGYKNFVSPIINRICMDFEQNSKGLDFGAGHTPIVTKILKDKGFEMKMYDPFFHPYYENLEIKYDFIASCEVIEHFYNPKKEFTLLKSVLKKSGILYCMTDIYDESINFENWYYKNDPTHVFIYQKKTIEYIKDEFKFINFYIDKRLILFYN